MAQRSYLVWNLKKRRDAKNGNEREPGYCQCGCGGRVSKPGNRFILGHNRGRAATGACDERDNNTKKRRRIKRESDGKFKKGFSANPSGRPKKCLNKNTALLENILKGSSKDIVNKITDMALKGNTACLKMALSRLYPVPRMPSVNLDDIPELKSIDDVPEFIRTLLRETMQGNINAEVLDTISRSVDRFSKSFEIADLEKRIAELEDRLSEPK